MMPRMWTPEKERVGIEVYTLLTDNENGFWFFEDFIHRLRLNHKRIERILEKCLPISNRFAANLERISNRELGLGQQFGFIPRCNACFRR